MDATPFYLMIFLWAVTSSITISDVCFTFIKQSRVNSSHAFNDMTNLSEGNKWMIATDKAYRGKMGISVQDTILLL